jgi:hypothetical protein
MSLVKSASQFLRFDYLAIYVIGMALGSFGHYPKVESQINDCRADLKNAREQSYKVMHAWASQIEENKKNVLNLDRIIQDLLDTSVQNTSKQGTPN